MAVRLRHGHNFDALIRVTILPGYGMIIQMRTTVFLLLAFQFVALIFATKTRFSDPHGGAVAFNIAMSLNRSIELTDFDRKPLNVSAELLTSGLSETRALVFVQRLFIHRGAGFHPWLRNRVDGVVQQLISAVQTLKLVRDFEFLLYVDDPPRACLSKHKERTYGLLPSLVLGLNTFPDCLDVAIPDNTFVSWTKDFYEITEAAKLDRGQRNDATFFFGQKADRLTWFDYWTTMAHPGVNITFYDSHNASAPRHRTVSRVEHCNYTRLLHLEGRAYATRLKYLMMCGGVVLADLQYGYREFWHVLLIPWATFVPVHGPESLVPTLALLDQHEALEAQIAGESFSVMQKALSPSNLMEYWRLIIDRLSDSIDNRGLSKTLEAAMCRSQSDEPIPERSCIIRTVVDFDSQAYKPYLR